MIASVGVGLLLLLLLWVGSDATAAALRWWRSTDELLVVNAVLQQPSNQMK